MDKKNDLISKIIELDKKGEREKIEVLIEERLKEEPNNVDLWLRLAKVELLFPFCDNFKSIACLEEVLKIEKDNPIAILMLAYVTDLNVGTMGKELMNKLCLLKMDFDELNSMFRYMASRFYWGKNSEKERQLLEESINIYKGHVNNYVRLADLYFLQGRDSEAKELIKQALKNVKKVYSEDLSEYDSTDPNEFIEERIKGVYMTSGDLESIKAKLKK